MAKVSVIIPVYGVEKYIERCADNLFQQTLQDIEYIFVDDCTPDCSIELLQAKIREYRLRLAEENKVVRIVKMPSNSGLGAVRRTGIQLATGDYIIHCDSDDWPEITMYEKMYKKAVEGDYDIVSCNFYKSKSESNREFNNRNGSDIKANLLLGPLWNRLVRASICKDNYILYPKGNKAEDGVLMIQYSFYAKKRGYVDEPLYNYFINDQSITRVNTEENCILKLRQEEGNLYLIMDFLRYHNVLEKYIPLVSYLKYQTRNNLLPVIRNKGVYELWRNTFPEIDKHFYICKFLPFKSAIKYLMLRLRLL